MIALHQRTSLLSLIQEACQAGARLARACQQIGLSARTVQRWRLPGAQDGDRRQADKRAYVCPANKLTPQERQAALDLQPSCGEQRQPLFGVAVSDLEIPPAVAAQAI